MKGSLVLLTILTLSSSALAEYRAFQYLVKTTDPYAVANRSEAQYIVSTLNPQNFKSFHGGSFISIELLRTWMCPGYTGARLTVCPHPYDRQAGVQ